MSPEPVNEEVVKEHPAQESAEAGAGEGGGKESSPPSGSTGDLLQQLGDAGILAAFPGLAKPHKWLMLVLQAGLAEELLEQILLSEEIRHSRQPDESLAAWRQRRWNPLVEQAFIAQRHRFEKVSYYHLSLPDRGVAMELYFQLSNGEVSFDALLAQYLPPKAGKPQKGILRERPLHKLPKPLAKRLRRGQPGIPLEPMVIGQTVGLFQLLEWHPPSLDDATRSLLIRELEAQWLHKQLRQRLEAAVKAANRTADT